MGRIQLIYNGIIGRVNSVFPGNRLDLLFVAGENCPGDPQLSGLLHREQHISILRSTHGDDLGAICLELPEH